MNDIIRNTFGLRRRDYLAQKGGENPSPDDDDAGDGKPQDIDPIAKHVLKVTREALGLHITEAPQHTSLI